jgi:1-pyrroline-5-carboxylate dehydrogenase
VPTKRAVTTLRFGGWKASGSSGKNAGGHYYLPLYMHEQIHTLVK